MGISKSISSRMKNGTDYADPIPSLRTVYFELLLIVFFDQNFEDFDRIINENKFINLVFFGNRHFS